MNQMTNVRAKASGKCILFGEHAVVYGRPAIAIPVTDVEAQAELEAVEGQDGWQIFAPDLGKDYRLAEAAADDPLAMIIRLTANHLGLESLPAARLRIRSTIPLGRGLGSGAAISTAIVRAMADFMAATLTPAEVSALVYEVEKIYHGTPSGIDNMVIAFEQPVYFIKDRPIERLRVARPFTLVIADTGRVAPTHEAVSDLRRRWQADRSFYERFFDQIGAITDLSRIIIEEGTQDLSTLGRLMDNNQAILEEIDISSPELQRLVEAARQAGALGAKLSGAGWGGNMIALVRAESTARVVDALRDTGAVQVIVTEVESG